MRGGGNLRHPGLQDSGTRRRSWGRRLAVTSRVEMEDRERSQRGWGVKIWDY